jgi:hypothetical protein
MRVRTPPLAATAILAALFLAGCQEPGPPPVTSIADRSCAAAPDLSSAKPVELDAKKSVKVTLDGAAPCWESTEGNKSVYAVFKFPEAAVPYMVAVYSEPLGQGLFTPRVITLDAAGVTQREIGRDSFRFNGNFLHVSLRVHDGERYLLVASDPKSVGQQVNQISESTNTYTGTSAGGGVIVTFQVHTGSDTERSYTFSLNGKVEVSAQPIPDSKDAK